VFRNKVIVAFQLKYKEVKKMDNYASENEELHNEFMDSLEREGYNKTADDAVTEQIVEYLLEKEDEVTIIYCDDTNHGWDWQGNFYAEDNEAHYKTERVRFNKGLEEFIGLGCCGIHVIMIDEVGHMHDNMRTPKYSKTWCLAYDILLHGKQKNKKGGDLDGMGQRVNGR